MIEESNFLEGLLRDKYIGSTVYDDDGNAIVILNLNYDPLTKHIYISDGTISCKMSINRNYDFETVNINKVVPDTKKIKGKKTR